MRVIEVTEIDLAARAIEAGELVIVPTSRWYMICADARNSAACDLIYAGKKRPTAKVLASVHSSVAEVADAFTMTVGAEQLAQHFWPGDLAMILPWREDGRGQLHKAVGTPNALVTVASGVLGTLAGETRTFVAATTASISGGAEDGSGPAISLPEVESFLHETGLAVAAVVDGGICPLAVHLTIVDCTREPSKLVRAGVIHERAVRAALI